MLLLLLRLTVIDTGIIIVRWSPAWLLRLLLLLRLIVADVGITDRGRTTAAHRDISFAQSSLTGQSHPHIDRTINRSLRQSINQSINQSIIEISSRHFYSYIFDAENPPAVFPGTASFSQRRRKSSFIREIQLHPGKGKIGI